MVRGVTLCETSDVTVTPVGSSQVDARTWALVHALLTLVHIWPGWEGVRKRQESKLSKTVPNTVTIHL